MVSLVCARITVVGIRLTVPLTGCWGRLVAPTDQDLRGGLKNYRLHKVIAASVPLPPHSRDYALHGVFITYHAPRSGDVSL